MLWCSVTFGQTCLVHHTQNSELGFLFEAPRTRSGRIVKTSTRLCFGCNLSKCNGMLCQKTFFFVKREIPLLFFVNCERANLFFVKRDLYPPFTTLLKLYVALKLHNSPSIFIEMIQTSKRMKLVIHSAELDLS